MDGRGLKSEGGFGLIELLISMVIMQIALLAILGAFSAGAVALGRASHTNTASALADQQMELYRSMPYDAIGLDTAGAPTTGTYVGDTGVCTVSLTPVCGNIPPENNSGSSTWSCTATSGTTSVSLYFTANGANPCTAHRVISGASSPDGHGYAVDSYIKLLAGTSTTQRALKQVSIVVRDGSTAKELAKEVTTFDCSTGTPPNSPPC